MLGEIYRKIGRKEETTVRLYYSSTMFSLDTPGMCHKYDQNVLKTLRRDGTTLMRQYDCNVVKL